MLLRIVKLAIAPSLKEKHLSGWELGLPHYVTNFSKGFVLNGN